MNFSIDSNNDRKIKKGLSYCIAALASLSLFGKYKSETDVIEETKHLVNSIRLGLEKGEREVTISGVLENIGGTYGDTHSDCHFNLFIDKKRSEEPTIEPIRVVIKFNGYNDMASRRGERYRAIVSGYLKQDKSFSLKPLEFKIEEDEKHSVDIHRMWFYRAL